MAEKNSTSADDKPKKEPTPLEAMFFFAIVKHTKNKADIDWAGVAAEQGFKSAEVAKVRFGQVKRKLGINDATTPARKSPASTPTKVTKTPTKSPGGRQKAPVKKEESDTDEDTKVKTEVKSESRGKSVKRESDEDDADPSTQLQADMDAMLNEDPF